MRDDRPVNRCRVKGCPVIGFWDVDGLCPMHADDIDYQPAPIWEDDE